MICYPNVKINLGLRVLRRRPDGYHDLETLFVPYHGITDILEVITGDDYSRTIGSMQGEMVQAVSPDGKLMISISREGGVDWNPLEDLTAKAYFLLSADYKLPPMKIFLQKRSPVGAGLGGGSADAAFALRAMSELGNLGLDDETLAGYASRLGSDCAFFIYNRPMMGKGRGEILKPFDIDLSSYKLEVVVPDGISVSTAEAYRGITPSEEGESLEHTLRRPVSQWKDCLVNDFEKTVFAVHPQLAEIKASLYEKGAAYAAMSGSGSALFYIK